MPPRPPLTRERVVTAAAAVADRGGLAAVSMRSVGRELGVEAMSLYHHVAGKDDLVDALADHVFTEIPLPALDAPWRPAMADRAASVRAALTRHPWGLGLIESRRSGVPQLLRHHDTVLGCLRRNGFSVALAAHAFSAIDAYVYGFVLTEQNLPIEPGGDAEELSEELAIGAAEFPYLAEYVGDMVIGRHFDYGDEFTYGLDLLLDALAARLADSLAR